MFVYQKSFLYDLHIPLFCIDFHVLSRVYSHFLTVETAVLLFLQFLVLNIFLIVFVVFFL